MPPSNLNYANKLKSVSILIVDTPSGLSGWCFGEVILVFLPVLSRLNPVVLNFDQNLRKYPLVFWIKDWSVLGKPNVWLPSDSRSVLVIFTDYYYAYIQHPTNCYLTTQVEFTSNTKPIAWWYDIISVRRMKTEVRQRYKWEMWLPQITSSSVNVSRSA